MARAKLNGLEHEYETYGQGTPVLFIHGGYGGHSTSLVVDSGGYVPDLLPRDCYQTITYDRRNCRRSEYTLDHFTLEDLANDAVALLDHLGLEKAVVVGTSAGGPIAQMLALSHPERILALCLTDTGPNLMNPERAVSRENREFVARAAAEGDRAVFESRKQSLRNPPPPPPYMARRPGALGNRQKLEAALATVSDDELCRLSTGEIRNWEAYIPYDFTSRLSEIRGFPVIVMHGDSDNRVPYAWGQSVHAGIPDAEFVSVAGADHGLLGYENGAEAFRTWLASVTAKTPA